jgi:hypothetical protein
LKRVLAGVLAVGVLVFASVGLGAASFSDPPGDDNAAPDVTSVTLSESADGMLTIAVAVQNYQALPENSWFNLWFDLDSDPGTGDAGDEALVRYLSSGAIEFYLWDGAMLVEQSSAQMTARYEAGLLTVAVPKTALGSVSAFGILAVSARGQDLGDSELIATDYAPDLNRSPWVGPALAAFPDPTGDQDAAPDVTTVGVSDAKDGWISFAISTPNYVTLPGESVLVLSIDRDNRASTGDDGAEILISDLGGELLFERWDAEAREWKTDAAATTRVRMQNSDGVVTIRVHRSELDDAPRFGFSVATADLDIAEEAVLAIDFAPDGVAFWRYTLVNQAVRLIAGKAFGTPASPHVGRAFTINLPVRRSDTSRGITSGRVTCNVTVGGKRVRATGKVGGGRGQCTLVVPAKASVVRGSMTVRLAGKSVTARFSFRVR